MHERREADAAVADDDGGNAWLIFGSISVIRSGRRAYARR
jgi:hypothetical protein